MKKYDTTVSHRFFSDQQIHQKRPVTNCLGQTKNFRHHFVMLPLWITNFVALDIRQHQNLPETIETSWNTTIYLLCFTEALAPTDEQRQFWGVLSSLCFPSISFWKKNHLSCAVFYFRICECQEDFVFQID